LLGASSATERDSFINWGRGDDVQDENNNTITAEKRPSVHGDVVHSRPVALNFGTDAAPKVSVFYGANDGVLRALNGNRDDGLNIGGITPGNELWRFLPPEFYGSIKRIYDNTQLINYPSVERDFPGVGRPKPYGPDGSITALFDPATSERQIYATMRRGGRVVYGFNVNPSNPANITAAWKVGCPDRASDANCGTGFSGIGQTWSAAISMTATAVTDRLIIFGGGYDNCEDADPNTCTASSKGNKVYVVNAATGALVKAFDTDRPVIADVAVVDDLTTGKAVYGYVADLGGNVYRITFGTGASTADWSITKIASLGCATTASCTNNRKFMFEMDVIEDNGLFYLLLGSGDREKPLRGYTGAYGVSNYFFMIKDTPADTTWLSSETVTCGGAVICLDSLVAIDGSSTANPDPAALDVKKGWFLSLNSHEQVVTSSITFFGIVSFSTHEPQAEVAAACSTALGTTRVYNISFKDASPEPGKTQRSALLPPVGLPPSPVGGKVILDDGSEIVFCIGCNEKSPLQAEEPPVPEGLKPTEPNARAYWYVEK